MLWELLAAVPLEELVSSEEADVVPEDAPEVLPEEAGLVLLAGAPATVTSSVLLDTRQSL